MVILGSLAAYMNGVYKTPNDKDIVATIKEWSLLFNIMKDDIKTATPRNNKIQVVLHTGERMEVSLQHNNKSDEWLIDHQDEFNHTLLYGMDAYYPPLELLFLTKKSHVHCNLRHFDKTMHDYHELKELIGDIPEHYYDYYEMRKNEAEERYRHRTPSLNVSNDDFFDRSKDIVGYVFVHDSIHESVKHYDVPVYEMIKRDHSKALCEADMFHNLDDIKKVRCVQEEAYVIAIERYLLLDDSDNMTPYIAYKNALKRICTTLCSGFFRDYAINNYYKILDSYDPKYTDWFAHGYNMRTVQQLDTVDDERVKKAMTNFINNID